VDKIFSQAALKATETLNEGEGMGVLEDKTIENHLATRSRRRVELLSVIIAQGV